MTTTMSIRIDGKLKKKAQKIASDLGMDLSTAIKLFLVQMTTEKGLPFHVSMEPRFTPKEEKRMAKEIEDALRHGKRYSSAQDMFRDILGK